MKEKLCLTGSSLKLIAIISMFIDHFGAAVISRILNSYPHSANQCTGIYGLFSYETWLNLYQLSRAIGRIAFPIFCFLLVEGFSHTHNVKKYAFRLLAFCFLSEIPFDLAFQHTLLEFHSQNVFFTLFLGLLTILGLRFIKNQESLALPLRNLLSAIVIASGMFAAFFLRTDYSYIGVFCIVLLFLTQNEKPLQLLVGCISFLWELPAPAAFLPIALYNGKRGRTLKYFFYFFYPAHLLFLVLVCRLLSLPS